MLLVALFACNSPATGNPPARPPAPAVKPAASAPVSSAASAEVSPVRDEDLLFLEEVNGQQAIDSYKVMHRRRFITYDEMLAIVKSLGYHK